MRTGKCTAPFRLEVKASPGALLGTMVVVGGEKGDHVSFALSPLQGVKSRRGVVLLLYLHSRLEKWSEHLPICNTYEDAQGCWMDG